MKFGPYPKFLQKQLKLQQELAKDKCKERKNKENLPDPHSSFLDFIHTGPFLMEAPLLLIGIWSEALWLLRHAGCEVRSHPSEGVGGTVLLGWGG